MNIKEQQECLSLLIGLQKRGYAFPFRKSIQPVFRINHLPSGNGWAAITEKYMTDIADKKLFVKYRDMLQDIYQNAILFSDAGVMHNSCDINHINQVVQEGYVQISNTKSHYTKTYPLSLPENALKKIKTTKSDLMEIKDLGDYYCFVFCYTKAFSVREKLSNAEIQKLSFSYSSAYGIKQEWIQSFDKIFINKQTGDVFFCIDNSTANTLTYDETVTKVDEYIKFLESLHSGKYTFLQGFSNFFPLIKQLYTEPSGRIVGLNHLTPSGSDKEEKMTGRLSGDLRTEDFHKYGIQHVTDTSMYAIEKEFPSFTPELNGVSIFLPGRKIVIGDGNPNLSYAIVKSCTTAKDFFFILDKLKN